MDNLELVIRDLFYLSGYYIPKNSKNIDLDILIKFICSEKSCRQGALGFNSSDWQLFIHEVFPDKVNNRTYLHWLLNKYELHRCTKCKEIKSIIEFSKNKSKSSGLNSFCKQCQAPYNKEYQRSYSALRRATKWYRTPNWVNLLELKNIYNNCQKVIK